MIRGTACPAIPQVPGSVAVQLRCSGGNRRMGAERLFAVEAEAAAVDPFRRVLLAGALAFGGVGWLHGAGAGHYHGGL